MQRALNHFVWMLVTLQQYFNRTCMRDLALNSGIQTTACCCSYHEGYTHIFSKATCPIHVIFGSAVRVYMFDYPIPLGWEQCLWARLKLDCVY